MVKKAKAADEPRNSAHVFGRMRPSASGGFSLHTTPKRDTHFRELPAPTGKPPYQLDLRSIVPEAQYKAIVAAKKLVFHLNGDMGGIGYDVPQTLVAKGMEADFDGKAKPADNPAFLYICGDCVYFNGEIKQYYNQFYRPYEFYPAAIFAVPGNHDGENLPGDDSLDGFVRNFCAAHAVKMPESGDSPRTAMVQPNVFWTLLTPLASFVGLYSNVPEGGEIKAPQSAWLADQLRTLPTDRPLFVSLHHPIYSADDHHSGSTPMKRALEQAALAAKRQPDMVFAGHVHNYQRLTRSLAKGAQLPYLVTGAGGYHNLHSIIKVGGEPTITPVAFKDSSGDTVTLERYCDDRHGFLRLEVTDKLVIGRYFTVPRPQEPYSKPARMIDYFEFDWRRRRYVPNAL
ncbi:MAG TPA: metallophosphoesterase [Rubrivivax sp.]|nr:metallophosphoesterase [Rubrivivax sp.]HPO20887.1 metallophosphoesterase [Rubrivivax sp.]